MGVSNPTDISPLVDIAEDFREMAEQAARQTKVMIWLTGFIAILTVTNVVLVAFAV